MATRTYKRDKKGRFAGSGGGGGGTFTTTGKAGGFANAGFRARVQAGKSAGSGGTAPPTKAQIAGQKRLRSAKRANIVNGAIVGGVVGGSSNRGFGIGVVAGGLSSANANRALSVGSNGRLTRNKAQTKRIAKQNVAGTIGLTAAVIASPSINRSAKSIIGEKANLTRARRAQQNNGTTRIGNGRIRTARKSTFGGAYKVTAVKKPRRR